MDSLNYRNVSRVLFYKDWWRPSIDEVEKPGFLIKGSLHIVVVIYTLGKQILGGTASKGITKFDGHIIAAGSTSHLRVIPANPSPSIWQVSVRRS